jgi:hypothetical protein
VYECVCHGVCHSLSSGCLFNPHHVNQGGVQRIRIVGITTVSKSPCGVCSPREKRKIFSGFFLFFEDFFP